jgi:hypothetical protein
MEVTAHELNRCSRKIGGGQNNKAVQLDMPRPWTGNKPIFVRLTAAEIELLKQEKAEKKLYSLSAALEKAVCSMLDEVDLEQNSLWVLAPRGNVIPRTYMVSPETLRWLNEAAEKSGFRVQDIVRAAVGRLKQDGVP